MAKMSSKAYTDGFYYVPRIDKEVVKQYKEDVIVLTGNLYGEVPSKILNVGEKQAEDHSPRRRGVPTVERLPVHD